MSSDELRRKITDAVKNAQPAVLAQLLAVDNVPDLNLAALHLYDLLIHSTDTTNRAALIDCFRVLLADRRLPLSIELFDDIIKDKRQMTDLLAVVLELGVPAHRDRLHKFSVFAAMARDHDKMMQFIVAQPFFNVNEVFHGCRLLHLSIIGRGLFPISLQCTRGLLAAPNIDVNLYVAGETSAMMSALDAADDKCASPGMHGFMNAHINSTMIFANKALAVGRVRMLLDHDDIDIYTLGQPAPWQWDTFADLLMFEEFMGNVAAYH